MLSILCPFWVKYEYECRNAHFGNKKHLDMYVINMHTCERPDVLHCKIYREWHTLYLNNLFELLLEFNHCIALFICKQFVLQTEIPVLSINRYFHNKIIT